MCILNWLEAHSNTVIVIILFFTVIATWRSARAAKRAATETQKATQASLIANLLDDYSSPEMLDAMLRLDEFKNLHGENFADEFRRLRIDNYDLIHQVDHGHRRVSHFFNKIYILKKLEYLNDNAVKEVATKGQVEFFRNLVEPLEAALNVDYDRSAFESLGKLYDTKPVRLPMANPKPK
jgi:hypothetical protein